MKIAIDEQGNVDPPNSADLLAAIDEPATLLSGGAIPTNPVLVRTFQGRICRHTFKAPAGQVTVHECSPE